MRCACHSDESCRKERTAIPDRRKPQGRPLGSLLQFLFDAHNRDGLAEHYAAATPYAFADRLRRREEFIAASLEPGADPVIAIILDLERKVLEGESIEPGVQP